MKRGEIRWYTFRLPDKRRPVLVLTRNAVIERLNEIIVVPAPRTIRGLTTEVVLTADDGMPAARALNFDHVSLAQRDRIGPVLCKPVRNAMARSAACATHCVRVRRRRGRLKHHQRRRPENGPV